jgi:hypothetical protein
MALSRFVLTSTVILPPEVLTAISGGFGSAGGTAAAGKWDITGATFPEGTVIYADSVAGTDFGSKLLYQAIGAGNLRAYVQGQDDVGHAALAN